MDTSVARDTPLRTARGLRWYWKRLKVMSPAELLHRVVEQTAFLRLRLLYRSGLGVRAGAGLDRPAFCRAATPVLPLPPIHFNPSQDEVARWLSGQHHALGFAWTFRDDPAVWHTAPDTGKIWPRIYFGDVPYRAGNPYGDARVVWEPSRLQQLVSLALLARDQPEHRARAVRLVEDQFLSWVLANPPLEGVHYVSAMECGLRLIACCHALDIVRPWLTRPDKIWRALTQLVTTHAVFISQRLSLHSSHGNHTVCECAGLLYAALLFPELSDAGRFRRMAMKHLESGVDRLIHPDGGGTEQATQYLLLVSDLYGLVISLLSAHQQRIPENIEACIMRARGFLAAISSQPGSPFLFGDSDGGVALHPGLQLSWTTELPAAGLVTFPYTGCTVLRDPEHDLVLLFDHGPIGMPPLYGHGHADALAVLLSAGGQDILTDTGTFSYTGDLEWRKYFRSTPAHNTITVDCQDQSGQETTFMWNRSPVCELRQRTDDDACVRVLASHDGYLASHGVLHTRGIVYRRREGILLIWDHLRGAGHHTVEANWHIATPSTYGQQDKLKESSMSTHVHSFGFDSIGRYSGSSNPPAGFRSPRYGERVVCETLRCHFEGELPHEWLTIITLDGQQPDPGHYTDEISSFRALV